MESKFKHVPNLYVDVCGIVDQQFKTKCPTGGDGCQMQWRVTMVIGLVDVGAAVHELNGDGLLSCVAGHVEGGVPEHVALINLLRDGRTEGFLGDLVLESCTLFCSLS